MLPTTQTSDILKSKLSSSLNCLSLNYIPPWNNHNDSIVLMYEMSGMIFGSWKKVGIILSSTRADNVHIIQVHNCADFFKKWFFFSEKRKEKKKEYRAWDVLIYFSLRSWIWTINDVRSSSRATITWVTGVSLNQIQV